MDFGIRHTRGSNPTSLWHCANDLFLIKLKMFYVLSVKCFTQMLLEIHSLNCTVRALDINANFFAVCFSTQMLQFMA